MPVRPVGLIVVISDPAIMLLCVGLVALDARTYC